MNYKVKALMLSPLYLIAVLSVSLIFCFKGVYSGVKKIWNHPSAGGHSHGQK